ncbi:MAG: glycoside hydrolase family 2 [Luteitalea sp.]|nr:glycoside hydrolase family 2 [Luteitalea sp.]
MPNHLVLLTRREALRLSLVWPVFSSALGRGPGRPVQAMAQTRQLDPTPPSGPLAQNTEKPWTRWWWPGSAVDKENLTWQLEQLAAAGIGGVEITPIYGARGDEDRYIEFLTPSYMEMLEHVGREAQRLGLGVDMATGTGWPFGGPRVTDADSSTQAVMRNGRLVGESTRMMVKRAAPGGEGLVVDPYSPEALRRYLEPFDRALAQVPRNLIRGQFHDSFEYYGANWTDRLPVVFREMHGYDVQQFAAELVGDKTMEPETLGRIKSDYRATLSRLHLDFLRAWAEWSHEHGFIIRNQSHGAPANLLDLYAAVDIPETEVFGSTPFPIPGLRRDPAAVRHDQDLPEPIVSRMSSSAAHVMGRQLTSSETATWLREHWKVALAYVKPELDRVLLDGINHVFYHGTVYSPQDAPWPGWLFYASTQFNPSNTWWNDFAALNQYVERVQSILQRGRPDNDILLYWPIHDIWNDPEGLEKQLTVHDVGFIVDEAVGKLARQLDEAGYAFDYVSDDQVMQTRAEGAHLITPGNRYRVLVVPAASLMPLETVQQIAELARNGAMVIFAELPRDVPGYGRLEQRRAELQRLMRGFSFQRNRGAGIDEFHTGRGELIRGDVFAALQHKNVPREPIAKTGVGFIRRESEFGHDYFLANLSADALDGWVALGVPAQSATLLNPLDGTMGVAAMRQGEDGRAQVYLTIEPGESFVLRTRARGRPHGQDWTYLASSGERVTVTGTWTIEFVDGGPVLPPRIQTTELKSWTELGGGEAERFGGTARYGIELDMPAQQAEDWVLDLGDVRETARVRLNGCEVATAWSLPFKVRVGDYLRPGRNVLELEVTNTAANRIRDMDRRGERWKIMREINFVNIRYEPFDASNWKIEPSGLLGPIALIPMRRLDP